MTHTHSILFNSVFVIAVSWFIAMVSKVWAQDQQLQSSVGNKLLGKANSWAHLKPTELKTLRVGPSKLCFNKLSRCFCSRFILFIYIWGYSPFLNSWDYLRLSHCQSFVCLISFCFSLNCVVLIAFGFEILVLFIFPEMHLKLWMFL